MRTSWTSRFTQSATLVFVPLGFYVVTERDLHWLLLVGIVLGILALNFFYLNGVRVALDGDAIYYRDPQLGNSLIRVPWTEIKNIEFHVFPSQWATLHLLNEGVFKRRFSFLAVFNLLWRELFGQPIARVWLSGLDVEFDQVQLMILEKFRARSTH
ncbi:MAG: hypothetical protein GY832_16020 [Chloroflexi bacterium]|nr:hypothetical protein [Chloroflexota bacterium]